MVLDLSPFLIEFTRDFGIRWYGLSYVAGFVLSYFLVKWISQRQKMGLSNEMVSDFITYGAIGILVGGRLGYCLFYSPDLFLQFRSTIPFWGVLAVNEGGMASHGGMIGLVIACVLFAMKHGLSQLYLFDLVALCGPVGIFFGRLANFINGELVGRIAPETYQWAVKFPQDIFLWPKNEFSRLRGLANVAQTLKSSDPNGLTIYSSEKWHQWIDQFHVDFNARNSVHQGLSDIVKEIQTGNVAAKEAIAPLLDGRYPSQLFAAFGEGLLIFMVLFFLWRTPKKPGVIGSLFVVIYAIVRIIDEQFRMPDDGIGFQLFGLTRGQWLSAAMLAVGIVLLFIWGRRQTLSTPGWGQVRSVKVNRR